MFEYVGQENEEEKSEEPAKKQKKVKKVKGAEAEAVVEAQPEPVKEIIPLEQRKVDYKKDFFGKPAFLTVSG